MTIKTINIIVFIFALFTTSLIGQDEITATLVTLDDQELTGLIKKVGANAKKIKFKANGKQDYQSVESSELKYIKLGKEESDEQIILHYTKIGYVNPKNMKTAERGDVWLNIVYQCEDIMVLENFIEMKRKSKKVVFIYDRQLPANLYLKKRSDSNAFHAGMSISRFTPKGGNGIGVKKQSNKLFRYYFRDDQSILDHIGETKITFDFTIEVIDLYCQ